MPLIPADPRYKYEDIVPPQLSVAQFDSMMGAVLDPEPVKKMGVYGLIVNGLRGLVVLIWITGREKLINQTLALRKQQYDRESESGNKDDLNKDNLSGERRP